MEIGACVDLVTLFLACSQMIVVLRLLMMMSPSRSPSRFTVSYHPSAGISSFSFSFLASVWLQLPLHCMWGVVLGEAVVMMRISEICLHARSTQVPPP
jgi:hypothetical protein